MPRLIDRSAFLYMDPVEYSMSFAQCVTCRFWKPHAERCALFITEPRVTADATGGLYVWGKPSDYQTKNPTVWPKDAGFETRPVRCENCTYFRAEQQSCHLFYLLNERTPSVFNLDTKVHPKGCCNANTPES
jgi:hypothetical protein